MKRFYLHDWDAREFDDPLTATLDAPELCGVIPSL